MTPKRIQRKRTRGWRMPEGAVYVGRPSRWGNPFRVGEVAPHLHRSGAWPHELYVDRHRVTDAQQAVRLFRSIIHRLNESQYLGHGAPDPAYIREHLAGRDLACWCPLVDAQGNRVPCHADVLLEIANSEVAP